MRGTQRATQGPVHMSMCLAVHSADGRLRDMPLCPDSPWTIVASNKGERPNPRSRTPTGRLAFEDGRERQGAHIVTGGQCAARLLV